MQSTDMPITAYFEADHDRLDALFNKYREKKREDVKTAKPYFIRPLTSKQETVKPQNYFLGWKKFPKNDLRLVVAK